MKRSLFILFFIPYSLFAQELDLKTFVETNHNKLADSIICQMAFDSFASGIDDEFESGMRWHCGAFHASNDSLLKVYHFEGEGCGAYCNPFFQSLIAARDSLVDSFQFTETEELDFAIDSIITLVKGKHYLIFGRHSGRPRGIEGVWGQSVVLCSIETNFKIQWSFKSTTSNLVEHDNPVAELSYDAEQQTISYQYDWYDDMDDFKSYRISGIWKYIGEIFEELDKKTEYAKD